MLFLAALWWRDAKPAVERRLRRLLRGRYCDPNIHFVIELIRRDMVPESDIRDHTVALLRHGLADGQQDEGRWVATAGWLHLLDPTMAIAEMENVVRYPGPTIPSRRRFAAVVELTKHDPECGAKNLTILANSLTDNLTDTPQDRFDTAVLIGDRDSQLGTQTMLRLANTPDMRELRVDAAIHVGSPTLLCELIERERTLSDDGRLRLAADLLMLEPTMAVATMEQFAQTARQVRYTTADRRHDPALRPGRGTADCD